MHGSALARRRITVTTAATICALTICSAAVPATPSPRAVSMAGTPVSALTLLESVPVMLEHRGGYRRDLFAVWNDADGDGCDTRAEVLRRESTVPVAVTASGCAVVAGAWTSTYDALTAVDPSLLEVDHVVALKESWDSGAWAWTPSRRASFANDLSDERTLHAVTAASNRSKGDRDPSNWLPVPAAQCRFLGDWVSIKVRWGLSADRSEWGRIRNVLRSRCADLRVPMPAGVPQTGAAPAVANAAVQPLLDVPPPPVPAPTLPALTTPAAADTPSSGPVAYANCAAVRAAGAAPLRRGQPGYRSGLDGDNDGVACEG